MLCVRRIWSFNPWLFFSVLPHISQSTDSSTLCLFFMCLEMLDLWKKLLQTLHSTLSAKKKFTLYQNINLRIWPRPRSCRFSLFCIWIGLSKCNEFEWTGMGFRWNKQLHYSLSLINVVRATHMIFQSLAVFQRAPTNVTIDRLISTVLVSHVSPNVLFRIKVVTHCTLHFGCNKLTVKSKSFIYLVLSQRLINIVRFPHVILQNFFTLKGWPTQFTLDRLIHNSRMSTFHVSSHAPRMKPFTALRTRYFPLRRAWNSLLSLLVKSMLQSEMIAQRRLILISCVAKLTRDRLLWCVLMLVLDVSVKTPLVYPPISIHTVLCDCLQTVDHIRHIFAIAKLHVVSAHVLVNSNEFWMFFDSTDMY